MKNEKIGRKSKSDSNTALAIFVKLSTHRTVGSSVYGAEGTTMATPGELVDPRKSAVHIESIENEESCTVFFFLFFVFRGEQRVGSAPVSENGMEQMNQAIPEVPM